MFNFSLRRGLKLFIFTCLLCGCVWSPKNLRMVVSGPDPTREILDTGFLVPTLAVKETTVGANESPRSMPTVQTIVGQEEFPKDIKSRLGFGLSQVADPVYWAEKLGATWYLDWSVQDLVTGSQPDHWQMVRLSNDNGSWSVTPSEENIQRIARKNPGQIWIIGNEPDVIWQDNIPAEVYAHSYHDLYFLIKRADSSAKLAPAGISQATDLRLAYLDRVMVEYTRRYNERLPVDWWTVHGFVLREEKGSWGVDIPPGFDYDLGMAYEVSDHGRMDLFAQQLVAFRTWMAINGYREKPLALTEFGILMPEDLGFSSDFKAKYLNESFTWLARTIDAEIGYPSDDNRLVQRWAWFSLADTLYPSADLVDLKKNRLTDVGMAFRDFLSMVQVETRQK
jgi:hypothetical protein